MSKYTDYLREHTGYNYIEGEFTGTQNLMEAITIDLCEISECERKTTYHQQEREHLEMALQGLKEEYLSRHNKDPEQYVIGVRRNFRNHRSKNKDQEEGIMSNYRKEFENMTPSSIQENMKSVVSKLHKINKRLLTIGDNESERTRLETQRDHYERMLEALVEAYQSRPELFLEQSASEFLFEARKHLWAKDKDRDTEDLDEI